MGWRDNLAALLGVSAYAAPKASIPSLDDASVERLRAQMGGQLAPLTTTQLRWYLADLESAQHLADSGDLSRAAQLSRAFRRDGVLSGLLSTRACGVVHLPKRFSGQKEIVEALEGRDGDRSVFDAMFPPDELETMCADFICLNVAVGELLPVAGREYPVLVRLDPEFLIYRWSENRWYYVSIAGLLPITPGDGRWVLITGGRVAPWQRGIWPALGQAWINKQHAILHKANWEAKLANPARAAVSPLGSSEAQRQGFLQSLIMWGINTTFDLPPGWDVKLIESNGRGYESFDGTAERSDREYAVAIAGQVVTVDGGAGFSNSDIHKTILSHLIKSTASAISHGINTQGIPAWVLGRWGESALEQAATVEYDTTPPKDLKAHADATMTFGSAVTTTNAALQPYGLRVDVREMATRFGVPLQDIAAPLDDASVDTIEQPITDEVAA